MGNRPEDRPRKRAKPNSEQIMKWGREALQPDIRTQSAVSAPVQGPRADLSRVRPASPDQQTAVQSMMRARQAGVELQEPLQGTNSGQPVFADEAAVHRAPLRAMTARQLLSNLNTRNLTSLNPPKHPQPPKRTKLPPQQHPSHHSRPAKLQSDTPPLGQQPLEPAAIPPAQPAASGRRALLHQHSHHERPARLQPSSTTSGQHALGRTASDRGEHMEGLVQGGSQGKQDVTPPKEDLPEEDSIPDTEERLSGEGAGLAGQGRVSISPVPLVIPSLQASSQAGTQSGNLTRKEGSTVPETPSPHTTAATPSQPKPLSPLQKFKSSQRVPSQSSPAKAKRDTIDPPRLTVEATILAGETSDKSAPRMEAGVHGGQPQEQPPAAFQYPEDFSMLEEPSAQQMEIEQLPGEAKPLPVTAGPSREPPPPLQQGGLEGGSPADPQEADMVDSVGETDDEDDVAAPAAFSQPAIFSQMPPAKVESPPALKLEMKDYLGPLLVEKYKEGNLNQLYPWQAECLNLPGVQEGRNLVYSAPTGAGKSAVAEVLTVCRWDATRKCALYVLPYVSLCEQMSQSLTKLLGPMNMRVKDYFGNLSKLGTLDTSTTAAIVCTIEKANALVNKLLEEGKDNLHKFISTVVVDELHMVGDESRGPLLELLLNKLRFLQSTRGMIDLGSEVSSLQIIGMSATLPNLHQVAAWLDAEMYETSFRPVELHRHIKNGTSLLGTDLSFHRALIPPESWDTAADDDLTAWLCKETVDAGNGVLVFCGTKKWCESVAGLVGRLLELEDREGKRAELVGRLKSISNNKALIQAVSRGVAFHTSSLSGEERKEVEKGFLSGAIRVIAATMTLAAGVNLPARRVILKHHWVGRATEWLKTTQIQQMAGRAGRKGLDTRGEVILVCPRGVKDVQPYADLLEGAAQSVTSCLHERQQGMTRALMDVIAAGMVNKSADIQEYVNCTLLAAAQETSEITAAAKERLTWLETNGFVEKLPDPDDPEKGRLWKAIPLGLAASASGLTPAQALTINQDFKKALDHYVMQADLHLTFLVTPVTEDVLKGQWHKFLTMYNSQGVRFNTHSLPRKNEEMLGSQLRSLGEVCGITPAFYHRLNKTQRPREKEKDQADIASRFFTAVVLLHLINEGDPRVVEAKFGLAIHSLESLKDRASGFAGMMAAFCQQMGYRQLELLIAKYQERVQHGVMPELVELARIQGVKGFRARQLYNANLRTVRDVAGASPATIEHAITKGMPSDRKVGQEREMALRICKSAKKLLHQELQEYLREHGAAEQALKKATHELLEPALRLDPSQEKAEGVKTPHNNLARSSASQPATKDRPPPKPPGSMGPPPSRTQNKVSNTQNKVSNTQNSTGQGMQSQAGSSQLQHGRTALPAAQGSGQEGGYSTRGDPQDAGPPSNLTSVPNKPTSDGQKSLYAETAGALPTASRTGNEAILHSGGVSTEQKTRLSSAEPLTGKKDGSKNSWEYKIIEDYEEIGALEGVLRQAKSFCFDLVMPPHMAKGYLQTSHVQVGPKKLDMGKFIQYIGICCKRTIWIIAPRFLPVLNPIFQLQTLKVCYDLKKVLTVMRLVSKQLAETGLPEMSLSQPIVDVRIAQFLLTPDSPYVTDSPEVEEWRLAKGKITPPLGGLALLLKEQVPRFQATPRQPGLPGPAGNLYERLAAISQLFSGQEPGLRQKGLMRPLLEIEMPLAFVMSEMECCGICMNPRAHITLQAPLERRREELHKLVEKAVGEEVDLSNPKAVSKALFDKDMLALPVPTSRQTKTGLPRTDAETLSEVDHDVARYIVEYRQIKKLLQDLDSYCGEKNVRRIASLNSDGLLRITASWLQTNSSTGRVTVENPNLQSIPKKRTFTVPNTQLEGSREFDANIRAEFKALRGWTMISGDYRQQELRIMAHLSGDEALCTMLKSKGDPFQLIADDWNDVDPSNIAESLQEGSEHVERAIISRDQVKQLFYGLAYGMGVDTLARKMSCRLDVAQRFIDGLEIKYPGLHKWTIDVVEACKASPDSSVRTLGGRLRLLPNIKSTDRKWRSEAERKAINTVPQGSAADIAKTAMIKLQSVIRQRLPHQCNVLLMIHDELVIEVEDSCKRAGALMLKECMEAAWPLSEPPLVPLAVRLSWGKSWGDLTVVDNL